MGLLEFFFRNKNNGVPYEETPRGKEFAEKMRIEAEERARKNEEWERTVPPERKEQVKLFKIFFSIFFIGFFILLWYGFFKRLALVFLAGGFIFAMLSLALFFIKPKFVKYPNCFMMPVLAFACDAVMFVFLGFQHGFSASFDKEMFSKNRTTETVIEKTEEELQDLKVPEGEDSEVLFKDEKDFLESDYAEFLIDNCLEDSEELKKDYMEYRRNNGR